MAIVSLMRKGKCEDFYRASSQLVPLHTFSVKECRHHCHTREESGRNSKTLIKATTVFKGECAFNADSQEAPFSIYADACGYYFIISVWIFTKILL